MSSRFALVPALLAVGVGFVHAQSISLSSGCQSALLTIAGSPEASCLNVNGLFSLFTSTSQSSSAIQPINSWLAGACAQTPCSNQTLSDIATNVTSGCASDLSSLGIDASNASIISMVQQSYPTVREIACLKESSNNTLCVTDLLTDVQNEKGTLSLQAMVSELPQLVVGGSLPSYITCSDCVKQAYNVLKSDQPSVVASETSVTNALQSQCGADFLSGSTPSDIAEGTGSAAPTGSSTASSAAAFFSDNVVIGVALSSLTTVFSAVALLA
ncbi:hypothetical protein DFH11DRAFT_446923 [Phellopilus nigrolimitatus]|nr:hypothetical protein DFH11DRAFT_446923 [Phellopilus nigrolimitatus]